MPPKTHQAYGYQDAQRTNIPTDRDEPFLTPDDRAGIPFTPEPVGINSHPVLSWRRGESVQHIRTDALPLYIHEKVKPAVFFESLTKGGGMDSGQGLFADFNGFPEAAKYDWYKHQGNWSNRIIRGNSIDVMASLAAREGMTGKVQMVYFDPPYGISFNSNFQANTRRHGEHQPEPAEAPPRKAFRDTYIDGLHSYMDAVYKIAAHARALLADSGSMFLQIGQENVHRLAIVLDEVFGAENRVATISFFKSGAASSNHLAQNADYLLWYAKDKTGIKFNRLYESLGNVETVAKMSWHAMVELPDKSCRSLTPKEREDPDANLPPGARLFQRMGLSSMGESQTGRSEPYQWQGTTYPCTPGRQWSISRQGMDRLAELDRLVSSPSANDTLGWKRYANEIPGHTINNIWSKMQRANDLHYVVETAESTIRRCILMATDPGDLVLDPTCGSGTTAFVAEAWGRRWITIDASTIPVALCRQRLLTATHKWYYTRDDSEGRREETALSANANSPRTKEEKDFGIRIGTDPASNFVYERVPYVSARHLAYGEPPRAILLVDKPLPKQGVTRVSAPFTVESHSPWVFVSPDVPEPETTISSREIAIRENVAEALRTTGIPSLDGEPISFDEINPSEDDPASWLTHEAVLRETGERAAVWIIPDDQSATPGRINTAATEAAGRGYGKLVVVAFHFEANIRPEQRGRFQVLPVCANRDLTIGELKTERSDSAFVMVGAPDVELSKQKNGQWTVTIRGYNVYDPSSGNLRHCDENNQIDCWMLDSNYDGKSFFARDIHFPGKSSDRQIKRLKLELGARISHEKWAVMESLTSAPFRTPDHGQIAVRIITSYGDEMLSVLPVEE